MDNTVLPMSKYDIELLYRLVGLDAICCTYVVLILCASCALKLSDNARTRLRATRSQFYYYDVVS
jgi:hypothetical protein